MINHVWNWPSREEWAYRVHHPIWDEDPERLVPRRLSDFATPEEIVTRWKAAFEEAEEAWRAALAAQRPIDDSAWETELEWRREIEETRGVRMAPGSAATQRAPM